MLTVVDHPLLRRALSTLRTASTPYGKATYWSDRYTKDTDQFDWYQRYAGIKSILAKYAKKKGAILDARARVPPTRDAVPQPPPRGARETKTRDL